MIEVHWDPVWHLGPIPVDWYGLGWAAAFIVGAERDCLLPRFWEHWIRDEADYARQMDYVHYNPVKHGLVAYDRGPGILPPFRIGGESEKTTFHC